MCLPFWIAILLVVSQLTFETVASCTPHQFAQEWWPAWLPDWPGDADMGGLLRVRRTVQSLATRLTAWWRLR